MAGGADEGAPGAATEEVVDVVVVGAGVAGIASALALAKRGLGVVLVESRSILGGRARSWVDGVMRDPVHIGPHVVVTEYPNFFQLLEELGTRDKIVWQPWRHFLTWVKGKQEHHVRTLPLPAPASWGLASMTDPFVSMADKHSTVPAAVHCLGLSEDELLALDSESGAEFLRRLGVREAYVQHFWGFLSHAILNVPVEEVSAAALVRFFRRLVGRSSMEMGFADCGLGELLAPARGLLEASGARTLTSTEVVGFLEEGGACAGVSLDDGRQLKARLGVVSTLPPQTLLPLLPRGWVQAHPSIRDLERLRPCRYLSVYLWFDRKVSEGKQMWARTYQKGDLNCEFYDFSEIYTGVDGRGTPWKERPSFIGSNIIDAGRLHELSDEELVEGTLRELGERFELAGAKVLHSVVNRVPMAIHRPVVGTERLRPDQASPVEGLYFGGCWTRTDFPSSMESAARGGYLAAERLLERHGLLRGQALAVPYGEIALGARLVGRLRALRPAVLDPLFRALVRLSEPAPQSKL